MSFLRYICCKSNCFHELDCEQADNARLVDETITYAKAKHVRNGNISGQSGSTKLSEPDIELQSFGQKKPGANSNGNNASPRYDGDASNTNCYRVVVKKEQERKTCNVIQHLREEFVKADQSVKNLLLSEFGAYCLRQRRKMLNCNDPDYNLFVNKMNEQMETFARENELKARVETFLLDHVPAIFVSLLGNFLDLNDKSAQNKDGAQTEQVPEDAKYMNDEKIPYAIAGQMMLDYLAYEKSEDALEINKFAETLGKDMDIELEQRLKKFAEQTVETVEVVRLIKAEPIQEEPIKQLSNQEEVVQDVSVETVKAAKEEPIKQLSQEETVQTVEIIKVENIKVDVLKYEEMPASCIETKNELKKRPEMPNSCLEVKNETRKQPEMEHVCFEEIKKAEIECIRVEAEIKEQQKLEAARVKAEFEEKEELLNKAHRQLEAVRIIAKEWKEQHELEIKKQRELEAARVKAKEELEEKQKLEAERIKAEAELKKQQELKEKQELKTKKQHELKIKKQHELKIKKQKSLARQQREQDYDYAATPRVLQLNRH